MSLVSSRSANTRDSSKHHFFLLHSLFLNLPFLLLLYIYIASVLCIPINNNKENLEHRSTVDGVQGDKVVAKRIGDVLTPVRRWPFASRRTLDEDTQHGDHRQSAVLNLLNLQDFQILRGGRDVVEVQRSARVDRVQLGKVGAREGALERNKARRRRGRVGSELFRTAHQDNQRSDGDAQPQFSRAESASGAFQKHLTGFSPVAAGNVERFRNDDTRDGQHSPSGVDDFRNAVLLDGTIRTQTERVKTVVTGQLTVEVGRDVRGGQETRRKVQLTVRA